jgi:hypothetical protein
VLTVEGTACVSGGAGGRSSIRASSVYNASAVHGFTTTEVAPARRARSSFERPAIGGDHHDW